MSLFYVVLMCGFYKSLDSGSRKVLKSGKDNFSFAHFLVLKYSILRRFLDDDKVSVTILNRMNVR